jgi:protein-L-isoaspartate(D-aspartate) O-methyltransferase
VHRSFFTEARHKLLDTLRSRGIQDEQVLNAIDTIPRESFVPKALARRAYEDVALPIGQQQTISQPSTVAVMTSLLQIRPGDKVLEIGTGSGYQAAILAAMGASVYTVERHFELYQAAREVFAKLHLTGSINTRFGDGSIGWQEFAPYQGIIVTAGAPEIPRSLVAQLAIGGRLIIPVGNEISQTLHYIERESIESCVSHPLDTYSFVPLVGREGWQKN